MSLIDRAMQQKGQTPASPTASTSDVSTTSDAGRSMIERAVEQQQQQKQQQKQLQQKQQATKPSHSNPAPAQPAAEAVAATATPTLNTPVQPPARAVKIDINALRERGLITPDGTNVEVTAEFRVIKRPLLENAFSRRAPNHAHANTVMISSAIPGEGKSFTALNLAMSLAMEPDHHVILVDADVHRFTLLRELGVESQLRDACGLADLLMDSSLPLEDCIYRTNIDKFSILPFGHYHPRATELFGSRAMLERIDELCTRYPQSMIVFDTPPILATTEARVLSRMLGQVVLVVEAGRTQRELVKEALGYIEGANIIGTILNKNRNKAGHEYYSGYYQQQHAA